jgi:hypothetical protein
MMLRENWVQSASCPPQRGVLRKRIPFVDKRMSPYLCCCSKARIKAYRSKSVPGLIITGIVCLHLFNYDSA